MRPVDSSMSARERRAAVSLASIYALRMLGLFLILPVLSLYSRELQDATPTLVGLAIGMYGLTQALFQIPFGIISDRWGRKPVIIMGLIIFAIGSAVAAMSETIWGVLLGRALQGSGAIAAVVMALAADLTREEQRVKAMAMIGTTIGLSFSVSLIAGPLLTGWIGVSGIFWLTAVLGLLGIVVIQYFVPQPEITRVRPDAEAVPSQFSTILSDRELLRLNIGIFVLHLILTATFVVVPIALRDYAGLPVAEHWWIYLGVMVISMGLMVPFVIRAEKHRRMKQVFVGAIVGIVAAQVLFMTEHSSLIGLGIALLVFFTAFNVLEATLPSLVSKTAPADKRGTAMGIYSTSQFLGAFCGGAAGGWLYGQFGITAVFILSGTAALIWMLVALTMRPPQYVVRYLLNVGIMSAAQAQLITDRLYEVRGVKEVTVNHEDGVAYLKVDNIEVDREALQRFSKDHENELPDNDAGANAMAAVSER